MLLFVIYVKLKVVIYLTNSYKVGKVDNFDIKIKNLSLLEKKKKLFFHFILIKIEQKKRKFEIYFKIKFELCH